MKNKNTIITDEELVKFLSENKYPILINGKVSDAETVLKTINKPHELIPIKTAGINKAWKIKSL